MASLSQSSWITSLHTTIPKSTFYLSSNSRPSTFRTLPISASALGSRSNDETSPPNSSDTPESIAVPKPDRLKLALERAKEYKKALRVDEIQQKKTFSGDELAGTVGESDGVVSGLEYEGPKEVLEDFRVAREKSEEYKQSKGMVGSGRSMEGSQNTQEGGDSEKEDVPEVLNIAMEKAEEFRNNKGKFGDNESNEKMEESTQGGKKDPPKAFRIAMEEAKKYRKNKGITANNSRALDSLKLTGPEMKRSSRLEKESTESKIGKNKDLKISSFDFIGLDFADKKKGKGLPAGLVPVSDPYPQGDLPEVEIIVGDTSNFESATSSETKTSSKEESSDLYKPKVSTWGMFPRPSNISKTFGGGKNIRPGEALESAKDRAAKEALTKQLVAAYKKKIGLNVDPQLKAECEEALKDGDSLMDMGRLKEALPYYQQVMDKLAFQTELHGLAALQWSICQDSLNSPEKARVMYEKLQSHPNARVNKKARQFMFSFQAMDMMKVTRSSISPMNSGYHNYFDAFVEDKDNYTSGRNESEEGSMNQALPYFLFLAMPILLVLLIAATKGM